MKKAFDLMMMHKNSRKYELWRTKYVHLVKIDRRNRDTINELNYKMEQDQVVVADLKS